MLNKELKTTLQRNCPLKITATKYN